MQATPAKHTNETNKQASEDNKQAYAQQVSTNKQSK